MKINFYRNHYGTTWGIFQNFGEEGMSTGYLTLHLWLYRLEILWSRE
jgi:hypothetical protein